jgi:shikimate kinase
MIISFFLIDKKILVYLCMEAAYIWNKVTKNKNSDSDKIYEMFNKRKKTFKINNIAIIIKNLYITSR